VEKEVARKNFLEMVFLAEREEKLLEGLFLDLVVFRFVEVGLQNYGMEGAKETRRGARRTRGFPFFQNQKQGDEFWTKAGRDQKFQENDRPEVDIRRGEKDQDSRPTALSGQGMANNKKGRRKRKERKEEKV